MHKLSRIFWPQLITPKNAVIKHAEPMSRSQKLLMELGLIKTGSNGTFQIMPIAQRSLDKCIKLVQRQMETVEGQKISLPVLTSARLWQKSGRLDAAIDEFFMLRDRQGKQFLLSPTHEEVVTSMLATVSPISYRQLPLRIYQIGPKFRDELKARFGLLRAKEFLMKDMYSFDCSDQEAQQTYAQVSTAYNAFFQQLNVPFVRVEASTGMMGGSMSHEYHYVASTGEDHLLHCQNCQHAFNIEVTEKSNDSYETDSSSSSSSNCPKCASSSVHAVRGIEVAHTFLLGDKYSLPFGATFLQESGKPTPMIMGCYGIGITRILAASLEVLSTDIELRWPTLLAPYDICIIGAKQGSKEEQSAAKLERNFISALQNVYDMNDVLLDDRNYLTIGKRLFDAKRMGYPLIVVIGSKCTKETPLLELHYQQKVVDLELSDMLLEIANYRQKKLSILNPSNEIADLKLENVV